jgi:hypothetical protein
MTARDKLHRIAEDIRHAFPGHAEELHQVADTVEIPPDTNAPPAEQVDLGAAQAEIANWPAEEAAAAEPTPAPEPAPTPAPATPEAPAPPAAAPPAAT